MSAVAEFVVERDFEKSDEWNVFRISHFIAGGTTWVGTFPSKEAADEYAGWKDVTP